MFHASIACRVSVFHHSKMFLDFRVPSGRTPVRVDDTYGCLSRPTCVDFTFKEVPRTFPRTSVGFMGASFLRLGHAALTMAEDAIHISKRGQELLPSDRSLV